MDQRVRDRAARRRSDRAVCLRRRRCQVTSRPRSSSALHPCFPRRTHLCTAHLPATEQWRANAAQVAGWLAGWTLPELTGAADLHSGQVVAVDVAVQADDGRRGAAVDQALVQHVVHALHAAAPARAARARRRTPALPCACASWLLLSTGSPGHCASRLAALRASAVRAPPAGSMGVKPHIESLSSPQPCGRRRRGPAMRQARRACMPAIARTRRTGRRQGMAQGRLVRPPVLTQP